jgi:hypothetical protein
MPAGCGAAQKKAVPAPHAAHQISYEVTASLPPDFVYYTDVTGGEQKDQPAPFPWVKTLTIDDAQVKYLHIASAVQTPPGSTTVPTLSCRITVDGKVASEHQSSGAVECSTSLPVKP